MWRLTRAGGSRRRRQRLASTATTTSLPLRKKSSTTRPLITPRPWMAAASANSSSGNGHSPPQHQHSKASSSSVSAAAASTTTTTATTTTTSNAFSSSSSSMPPPPPPPALLSSLPHYFWNPHSSVASTWPKNMMVVVNQYQQQENNHHAHAAFAAEAGGNHNVDDHDADVARILMQTLIQPSQRLVEESETTTISDDDTFAFASAWENNTAAQTEEAAWSNNNNNNSLLDNDMEDDERRMTFPIEAVAGAIVENDDDNDDNNKQEKPETVDDFWAEMDDAQETKRPIPSNESLLIDETNHNDISNSSSSQQDIPIMSAKEFYASLSQRDRNKLRTMQKKMVHFVYHEQPGPALKIFYKALNMFQTNRDAEEEHHPLQFESETMARQIPQWQRIPNAKVSEEETPEEAYKRRLEMRRREEREQPLPPLVFEPRVIRRLFYLSARRRPFDAYQVLLHYQRLQLDQRREQDMNAQRSKNADDDNNDNEHVRVVNIHMYGQLCASLVHMDPDLFPFFRLNRLVRNVIRLVMQPDPREVENGTAWTKRKLQHRLLPIIVSSLVEQRAVYLGNMGRQLFDYMIDNNFDLKPEYFEHLLGKTRYYRQKDLPYAWLLEKVVEAGRRPAPEVLFHVLENFYPYTAERLPPTLQALKATAKLIKQSSPPTTTDGGGGYPNVDPTQTQKRRVYVMDPSMVEVMGAAAAQEGCHEMCAVIWEIVDHLGYPPTVTMYENAVVAFSYDASTYGNMFAVLSDMERMALETGDDDWRPSRALIRNVSRRIRWTMRQLDFAKEVMLAGDEESEQGTSISTSKRRFLSTAGFNVILSSTAERGNLDRTLDLMEYMQDAEREDEDEVDDFSASSSRVVVPDAETYSFLFEALGKHLVFRRGLRKQQQVRRHYRVDERDSELLQRLLTHADYFLSQMELRGITPTPHIIREYVELLCLAGEVATATSVVQEMSINKGEQGDVADTTGVNNKTVYRVAMSNAELGRFDAARDVAQFGSEPMPYLLTNINRIERDKGMGIDVAEAPRRVPHV